MREQLAELMHEYTHIVNDEIKKYGNTRGWDMTSVNVYSDNKTVKVDFGQKQHLKFVDQGTQPFLMYALEGKIIPIGGSFRHVTGVGTPGLTRYERNGVMVEVFKEQRWRHPGIKAQNFVQKAFDEAKSEMGYKSHIVSLNIGAHMALEKLAEIARSTRLFGGTGWRKRK